MKTLEDTLREAAGSIRTEAAKMPDRSWQAPSRRGRSGMMVAAAVAALVVVVIGVPAFLTSGEPTTDAAGSPAVPQVPTTTPTEPARNNWLDGMPIYLPASLDWVFEGGEINEDEFGAVAELQWQHPDGSSLEVTVWRLAAPRASTLDDIEAGIERENAESPDDQLVVGRPTFNGITTLHTTYGDAHIFYWLEDDAEIRVRAYGPKANLVLEGLVRHEATDDAVSDLVDPPLAG